MKFLICIVACLSVFLLPSVTHARLVRIYSYAELTKLADVVVIVELDETKDTKIPSHPFGRKHKFTVEVLTQLKPLVIFKGSKDLDEILLIHFRLKNPNLVPPNGPQFVKFQKKRKYLVFLKKLKNNHYEPVNGQMDPVYSVKLLPN